MNFFLKGKFLFWRKPCRYCKCRFTVPVTHYLGARKVVYQECTDCVENRVTV